MFTLQNLKKKTLLEPVNTNIPTMSTRGPTYLLPIVDIKFSTTQQLRCRPRKYDNIRFTRNNY